jgi:hypothetical protein
MATYTWTAPGPGPGNWGTTTNWTPNGTPTNADTVLFSSANNTNCIVAANANAQILNFQDYAGTVTINTRTSPVEPFLLSVFGNLTLSTSNSFQVLSDANGLGTLSINANSVVTSNGRTIDCIFRLNTINTTVQLADTMTLSRAFTALGTPAGFIALRSNVPGTQRSLTLVNNGTSYQYVDYLNVTDIDSSAACTLWTYKGNTPSNSPNWYVMSTQPPPVSSVSIG